MKLAIWLTVLLVVLPVAGAAQTIQVTESSPLEAKLAMIDAGTSEVSTSEVAQYKRLLDTMDRRCTESRTNISDMAVRATQMIEEDRGLKVSVKRFLMEWRDATESFSEPRECVQVAATLMAIIG